MTKLLKTLAGATGLEPATSGVTGRSAQQKNGNNIDISTSGMTLGADDMRPKGAESVIKAKRPRYVVFVSGKWRWRPTADMRRYGFRILTLGHEITEEHYAEATRLNDEWDRVRDGKARDAPDCAVYVIGFGPYVKIGRAVDVRARVATLQTGAPETLKIFSVMPGTHREERLIHVAFSEYRLRGEWFRLEGRLQDWINRGCNLNEFTLQPWALKRASAAVRAAARP